MCRGLHDAGLHRTPRRSTAATLRLRDSILRRRDESPVSARTTAQQCVRATQPYSRTPRATVLHGEASPTSSATIQLYRRPASMDGESSARRSGQAEDAACLQPACSQPAASPPPPPPRFGCSRRDSAARARAPLSPAWKHPSSGKSTHERSSTSSPHLIHSCTTTSSPTRHTLSPYPSSSCAVRAETGDSSS
eukprot:SAG25_NODE_2345_length_1697_cov_1.762203_1_plen_192_part_10